MSFQRSDDGPMAILTLDHGELNLFDEVVIHSLDAETGSWRQILRAGCSFGLKAASF
jgi:hypothetical protein